MRSLFQSKLHSLTLHQYMLFCCKALNAAMSVDFSFALTLTGVTFILFTGVNAQSMNLCPSGWNETDYRCYQLLQGPQTTWTVADNACGNLGMGARVAYPADFYELAMLASIANGLDIWLGYISDGTTFKTFFNAIGFPNKFGAAGNAGQMCGVYKNTANPGDAPSYSLSSLDCQADTAYAICQVSYCSPVPGTPTLPNNMWIEYKLRCYYINTAPATYANAANWCAAQGSSAAPTSLAVPEVQEENDFMMRIFSLSTKNRWIGVKSEYDGNGNVYWNSITTQKSPSATFWPTTTAPSMPKDNTSCIYMNGTSGNGWSIGSCNTAYPSICRRVLASLSYNNCTSGVFGKYTSWTADCVLAPGSQTRRWRKCISTCDPTGCSQITAKYCQYQPKWSMWGNWGNCIKPSKGSFQMVTTPCLFNGQRTRTRKCMCGIEQCGGCALSSDSIGDTQSNNCNIYKSWLCPSQECTYCGSQYANTHCYEDGSSDSLTNNFRCVCNLGYYRNPTDSLSDVPVGCSYMETNSSDENSAIPDCACSLTYNECSPDFHSCTTEQLCQYADGGPHTCYCLPGYRKIPSGGCVAASRIPPQCKIVSGSSFIKTKRNEPLIPYERGYICTCGQTDALVKAGYSTRNSTTGEEAAARIVSRNGKYMCYCLRATVGPFLRVDPVTNRPVETKFNLTRQFMANFPECEIGYFDNMTYPKIPEDLFTDVDAKLSDLQKRTYFKCTGAEGFNSRFEYLTQPVLGEALSPPLEEPASELEALTRLLSVDEAAMSLFESMLSPDCETQRSYLKYIDVMSGTEVFIGNMSDKDVMPTFVEMQCGNWSFPPQAVDRKGYPGAYQPLISHCYPNATRFKSNLYNSTAALANQTSLSAYLKSTLKKKGFTFSYTEDFTLPVALINSGVLSISTKPTISKMPADVYITMWFPLYQPPAGFYQAHCTFYDFTYIEGASWRTKESGCYTTYYNTSTGPGYVRCQCSHMTIFAVSMIEVIPTSFYLAAFILNAIVVGGSALSILCLALTLLIFIQLRRFSTERIGIMLLCFTIGMTQALLLAGAKLTVSPNTCRIISIMLHFFGLLTFSLIGSLSLAMYFRFVSKFRRGWQNLFAYYGLSFGIPIVTVVISAGGFYYYYGVGYSCWMDLDGLIKWAFFVPFMIIGILSFYLLLKTAPVLYKVKGVKIKSFSQAEVYGVEFKYGVQKREKIEVIFDVSKKKFWGLIVLLLILFSTWILGVLSMQYDSVYYDYGFAIFNASQGFFIFIMFCIREEEVRILCCAGCMTKQQPAGKISWIKFVDIYERYFALVLQNQEEEKKRMTFNEFVTNEYKSGSIMPEDIVAMGPREYVSAQRGLARPNYLLSCSCCFPVRTAPAPIDSVPVPEIDLTQKLFVVGPDGQLMCLDRDGENAGAIMDEIGRDRPGSVTVAMGSAGPMRPSAGPGRERPMSMMKQSAPMNVAPVAEKKNWAPPPTLFPEFPDSDEEGEVAADIAAEVKINRDILPKASATDPAQRKAPSARPTSKRPTSNRPKSIMRPPSSQPTPADDKKGHGKIQTFQQINENDDDDGDEPQALRQPSASLFRPKSSTDRDEDDDEVGPLPDRKVSARPQPKSHPDRQTSAKPADRIVSAASRAPSASLFRPKDEDDDDDEPAPLPPKKDSAKPRQAPAPARQASARPGSSVDRPPSSSLFRPSTPSDEEDVLPPKKPAPAPMKPPSASPMRPMSTDSERPISSLRAPKDEDDEADQEDETEMSNKKDQYNKFLGNKPSSSKNKPKKPPSAAPERPISSSLKAPREDDDEIEEEDQELETKLDQYNKFLSKPASGKAGKSKKATSEIDPMELEDG